MTFGQENVLDDLTIRSVIAEHGPALLAYAVKRSGGDISLAEDVVQETLLRLWRRPAVLTNGLGSVRAWLYTVAHNLIVDRARASALRPVDLTDVSEKPPVERDHAEGVVDSLTAMAALANLSPQHREVLLYVYIREYSIQETAKVLGLPYGTVRSRIRYALRELRKQFDCEFLMLSQAA